MTDFKLLFILSALMFLFNAGESMAVHNEGIPPGNTHLIHHNLSSFLSGKSAVLSLSSVSGAAVKVAGVYWLPDFLKNNLGRVNDKSEGSGDNGGSGGWVPGGGGGDSDYACENYGYETPGKRNMQLYECDTAYAAGNQGGQCYLNCRCKKEFNLTAKDCKESEGKKLKGPSCEGKYKECGCMDTVTVGVGEKCDLRCGGNCVKKSCKAGVSVGTGEQCNERCASNSSVCTAKSCKAADNPGSGEECKERCASNSGICTRSGCKASVSVPNGYSCTEYCGSNCVRRGCTSTSGYQYCSCGGYGGSVYSCGTTYYRYCSPCCSDNCSLGSKYISCNSSQNKVKVSTTGCGSSCYECQAKCSPRANETGCTNGTQSCSDGCGGTRLCCKPNPWKYVRKECKGPPICWSCENKQYCGNYYKTGYAPVYTCKNYCKNTSTGEEKFICSLNGYGIFSAKAANLAECQKKLPGLSVPSGETVVGSCNADGTINCHY